MHPDSAPGDRSIAAAFAAYGLEPPVTWFDLAEHGSNNTVRGLHTGAGSFVLKTYDAVAGREPLLYEHRLLAWLGERGLPFAVAGAVATRDGDTLVQGGNGWQALFPLLPGSQPDEGNLVHVQAFGAALGELHRVLVAYPHDTRPGMWSYDELGRVHPRLPDPFALRPETIGLPLTPALDELCAWWRKELAGLRSFIDERYRTLPRQVIHGDYCPSNTLFVGDKLSAMLDFEFAVPGARAMDVASGFQWSLRPWLRAPNWELARAFWSGYTSQVRLLADEIKALPELMRLRNVASGVWWLGRHLTNGVPERSVGRLEWVQRCNTYIGQNRTRLGEMLA